MGECFAVYCVAAAAATAVDIADDTPTSPSCSSLSRVCSYYVNRNVPCNPQRVVMLTNLSAKATSFIM